MEIVLIVKYLIVLVAKLEVRGVTFGNPGLPIRRESRMRPAVAPKWSTTTPALQRVKSARAGRGRESYPP